MSQIQFFFIELLIPRIYYIFKNNQILLENDGVYNGTVKMFMLRFRKCSCYSFLTSLTYHMAFFMSPLILHHILGYHIQVSGSGRRKEKMKQDGKKKERKKENCREPSTLGSNYISCPKNYMNIGELIYIIQVSASLFFL